MSTLFWKQTVSGQEAKIGLSAGTNKSCDIIGATAGYRGRNNLFEKIGNLPHITKDGKDSLEQLCWEDPLESLALEIVKEGCKKTYEVIGDGTTLTCILIQAFFKYSLEELKKGKSPIDIKNQILTSSEKILKHLDSISVPITDKLLYDVAKTSANSDDELAKVVSDAFKKAGKYGIVSHKRSFTDETYIKPIEGNPIDKGYSHEGFINKPETQSVVFDNPLVLCSLINFQTAGEIIPFLEQAGNSQALVIISEMSHDVESVILSNVQSHGYPFVIIKPPYKGKKQRETMSDLAVILGCEVLTGISRTDYGGKEATYLGTCKRIEITKDDSVITISENVDQTLAKAKIDELTLQITHTENDGEKNYLRERISKISGGICTVMVGGVTSSEVDERVARVDDAISAVKSAKAEGVCAGGGIALARALFQLKDELDPVTKKVLLAPICKILDNASVNHRLRNSRFSKIFFHPILSEDEIKFGVGYDVRTYEKTDMFDAGILDTVMGIKSAFVNAISASNNLLMTDNVVYLKRSK